MKAGLSTSSGRVSRKPAVSFLVYPTMIRGSVYLGISCRAMVGRTVSVAGSFAAMAAPKAVARVSYFTIFPALPRQNEPVTHHQPGAQRAS
jgi:hypothetical protein